MSDFRYDKQKGVYALGGRSRSVHDARSGSAGPGGRDLPWIRESGRSEISQPSATV